MKSLINFFQGVAAIYIVVKRLVFGGMWPGLEFLLQLRGSGCAFILAVSPASCLDTGGNVVPASRDTAGADEFACLNLPGLCQDRTQ